MTTLIPIEPKQRIEILDVLRGFALLGIIFNNILYFSGYSFVPFDALRQFPNFHLNEKIYQFLDLIITAKFYTLFSMLFAVGFYLQFSKHQKESVDFLRIYRRRLFILLIFGLIHSLIWFGDILLMYALIGFMLILFRNIKIKNLFGWALFFILLPGLIDLASLPFFHAPVPISAENSAAVAHATYPDMTPQAVFDTFQQGTITEIFFLNIHNLIWKWLSYFPSGRFLTTFGIFLLGYYLGANRFFTEKRKSTSLCISSLIIGLLTTISAQILGGNPYQFPATLSNTFYKMLLIAGQIFMCIFYITLIIKIEQTSIGEKALKYLKPVGRMALTNYLLQTMILIIIFYNFGFNLFGSVGLIDIVGIAILILIMQIIGSNLWLIYFRFGPFEWLWRCLTYKIIL